MFSDNHEESDKVCKDRGGSHSGLHFYTILVVDGQFRKAACI